MAVGFFVPEDEERFDSSYHSNVSMTANSATQTPLQSPVNREFLVQVFCEALTRISNAGEYICPFPQFLFAFSPSDFRPMHSRVSNFHSDLTRRSAKKEVENMCLPECALAFSSRAVYKTLFARALV